LGCGSDDEGHLPEQVQDYVQSPWMLAYWRRKWGSTATPLLWSHAMHVVLTKELEDDLVEQHL
jgi:GH15 family glucan-1,4-alpha-glucosidase